MTGCPSLSSSDEEDSGQFEPAQCGQVGPFGTSSTANATSCCIATPNNLNETIRRSSGSRETLNNLSNNNSVTSKMSGRYSDFSEELFAKQQQQLRSQQASSSNLPTKISITAPSPRGSMREVNRNSNDSQILEAQMYTGRRQQQQQQQQQQYDEQMMVDRTSELSLTGGSSRFDATTEGGEDNNDLQDNYQADGQESKRPKSAGSEKSRSQLIDELLRTINDDSFNDFVDFNNKFAASSSAGNSSQQFTAAQLANSNRPKSALDGASSSSAARQQQQSSSYSSSARQQQQQQQQPSGSRPSSLALDAKRASRSGATPSAFDNVIRRMSTNFVQGFNKMGSNLSNPDNNQSNLLQQQAAADTSLRREKSSTYANSLYVDNQVPARRHSDNTINIPRIQVALSSPQQPRPGGLNQRASVSASKLANKWKLSAKSNQREASDKLSPSLGGALGYMRRHSSGNTTGGNEQSQSNGQTSHLLLNTSPFKVSLNASLNSSPLSSPLLSSSFSMSGLPINVNYFITSASVMYPTRAVVCYMM